MTVARPLRVAVALWIAWAIVVWNVVFDRVLVLAGRRYVYAASISAERSGRYLLIRDSMGPAGREARWLATAAAGAILASGCLLIPLARSRDLKRSRRREASGHAHVTDAVGS
jgi:hypothetical protein